MIRQNIADIYKNHSLNKNENKQEIVINDNNAKVDNINEQKLIFPKVRQDLKEILERYLYFSERDFVSFIDVLSLLGIIGYKIYNYDKKFTYDVKIKNEELIRQALKSQAVNTTSAGDNFDIYCGIGIRKEAFKEYCYKSSYAKATATKSTDIFDRFDAIIKNRNRFAHTKYTNKNPHYRYLVQDLCEKYLIKYPQNKGLEQRYEEQCNKYNELLKEEQYERYRL